MESRDAGSCFRQSRGVIPEILERRGPAAPVEGGEEDLPDVPPDRFLEARLVDQGEPGEDGAQRPSLREHLPDRAVEVRLAEEPVADEDVAEVLTGDVAPALDDVPLADRQPAPLPAVGDVEVARAVGHVHLAQQPEQPGRGQTHRRRLPPGIGGRVFRRNRLNHGDLGGSKARRGSRLPVLVRIIAPGARPCVMLRHPPRVAR